ncbi:MAG: hypothetical protein WA063_02015 [Minisyncoccia bacterium]
MDIEISDAEDRLKKIGAMFKGRKNQKIYVYDIPTIYYRFCEIRELLLSENKLVIDANIRRFKKLMLEIEDLLSENDWCIILNALKINDIDFLMSDYKAGWLNNIKSEEIDTILKKFKINHNKWIRLRESDGKTELTVKHVFEKSNSALQKVQEAETKVFSFEGTNDILEEIGLASRSYQEKIRISYEYGKANIEIDIWPMLKPYIEIESEDEKLIDNLINILNYQNNEIVSMNTEQLYKRIGIDIHKISQLKFAQNFKNDVFKN